LEVWGDGIAVDDSGHPRDVVAAILGVFDALKVDHGTIFAELESSDGDIRTEVRDKFFQWHLRIYTLGRRKAPIYWQLATSSASYSVWLYLHALTKDTLYKVQNDYLGPKYALEVRRLESQRQEVGQIPNKEERKALALQEKFVEELHTFLDEVKRVAPICAPYLDDGVLINFSPFWRLTPHQKQWQKELKTTWGKLCAGDFDWAHLAMHLWPERVIPKCAADRSLAIAQDLEDVFWVEGDAGKWKSRPVPTVSVEELVLARTSTAVKAALKDLLEAPSQGSPKAKRRRSS